MHPKDCDPATICNLADAGCDDETVRGFCAIGQKDCCEPLRRQEQIRLLRKHRKALLAQLHECQAKIDCLDYLLYRLREDRHKEENDR